MPLSTSPAPSSLTPPPSSAPKVRFGVVGCGWVARDYGIPGLLAAGDVTHLCDASGEAAAVCGAAIEAATDARPRVTTSLDALLADDAVEAVYVATPNHTHAAIVEACAATGKAVLCEKPLAESVAAAERMIDAAEWAGIVFATAYDQRWHPAHQTIRAMLERGELGTVTQARVHYACWLPPGWSPDGQPHDNWRIDAARAGGGAGIDLAPHGIDLLSMLLGADWSALHGLTQTAVHDYPATDGATPDDGAVLMGRLGDTLATLHVSYACPDAVPRRRLELIGTAGTLIAVNTMGQTAGGNVAFYTADGDAHDIPFDRDASPFAAQATWFADAVRSGDVGRFTPRRDLHHHRLLLAALSPTQ